MQAYSLDLRQRVVSAYENGVETILEVAERFQVSQSFIKKLLARKRATGEIAPIGHRGCPPRRLSDKHRKWLLKTVLAEPDITLSRLQDRLLTGASVAVAVPTLWRELNRLNLRRAKKSVVARCAQRAKAGLALEKNEEDTTRRPQISGRSGSNDDFDSSLRESRWRSANLGSGPA